MTLAKAQACASAIIGAGFDAQVHLDPVTGDWTVRALAPTFAITSGQIDSLVTSQSVNGKVAVVEFS